MNYTSFAHLLKSQIESFEFPAIEEEFLILKNSKMDEIMHSFFAKLNNDPRNYKEAMSTIEKSKWSHAVIEELSSMNKNQVWTLVDRTIKTDDDKTPNVIDSRWVFKTKTESDGRIKRPCGKFTLSWLQR